MLNPRHWISFLRIQPLKAVNGLGLIILSFEDVLLTFFLTAMARPKRSLKPLSWAAGFSPKFAVTKLTKDLVSMDV